MHLKRKIVWKIIRPLVIVFCYIKFRYTFKIARNLPDNCLILSNHNTDFDPLLVAVSFRKNLRFVASEHISRWKNAFKFINFLFNPIMRPKGTNAASTVKEILRTLRGGENVCMFAEGGRSWNGVTAPVLPSTGKLVKSSRCALVTYKLTGGYFVSPLWSERGTRKGKISGKVVNIYTPEQIAQMSVDEINKIIKDDLYEDAYDTMKKSPSKYKGKHLAEKLESMLFYCPECKAIDTLSSQKNTVACSACNHSFTYDEYGVLHNTKFSNVREAFSFIRDMVENDARNNIMYFSDNARVITVVNHVESEIAKGRLTLDNTAIKCSDFNVLINDIDDMNMHGKNALVFSTKDSYYEVKLSDNASLLKFYMLFQMHKYGSINKFTF